MNAVAFGNPTTGLAGGFLLVLHTKQLSKTSLMSFEIPVENNPTFSKDFWNYNEKHDQTHAILVVLDVCYTCHHQSQILNNVQWNQSYITFLKSQQHSVDLLTYTHLDHDQTFELCHLWYILSAFFNNDLLNNNGIFSFTILVWIQHSVLPILAGITVL